MRRLVLATLAAVALAACGGGHPRATPTATRTPQHHRLRHRAARVLPAAPAQVRGAAARRMPVPILMYHVIATPTAGTPYPGLWVPTPLFAAQMQALRGAG